MPDVTFNVEPIPGAAKSIKAPCKFRVSAVDEKGRLTVIHQSMRATREGAEELAEQYRGCSHCQDCVLRGKVNGTHEEHEAAQ